MRRSAQVEPLEPITLGDPELAAVAARALTRTGEVERATHGFHTWPAGLHPDAARDLIAPFPGTTVLDPFCGGGTVLVEACLAGRHGIGRDLSPIALIVAHGRTSRADDALLTRVRAAARRLTEQARGADELPPEPIRTTLREWYAPHVACELESLRRGIEGCPRDVQPALWLCFSAILVKASQRRSDTSASKIRRDRPPGTTAILFHKKVREYARRIVDFREQVPVGTPDVELDRQDARHLTTRAPVDLVLTSPPYPSTYDYLPMQHLRTVWLGLDSSGDEIGARRYWRQGAVGARRKWRDDTAAWTARAADCLRPQGHLVIVIGDGLTPSGPIDTSAVTEEAAKQAGLRSVARASVQRTDHARETVRWEHCFIFRRSP